MSPFDQMTPPFEDDHGIPPEEMPFDAMDFSDGENPIVPHHKHLESDDNFYFNLAAEMDDSDLAGLAADLMEEVAQDKESRREWEKTTALCMRYLGINIEEKRSEPIVNGNATIDSTMLNALIQAVAVLSSELLPAEGPCKEKIIGIPSQQTEDEAERVRMFMNNYLTAEDREYYPDSKKGILYTAFEGSSFKKVYQDPNTDLPVSRMIKSMDFIVNADATSLSSASRMTHVTYLTKREIKIREKKNIFKHGTMPDPSDSSIDDTFETVKKSIKKMDGVNSTTVEKKSVFTYYEIHVEIDPNEYNIENGRWKPHEDDDLPRIYIITICEQNKKVAAVRRGWKEHSPYFERDISFVNYIYLPGFGIYGIGICHLLGSNAIALTGIQRQTIDAALLKSFPGGLVSKQALKSEINDKIIGVGEFREIETGGRNINEIIMPMPYSDPSPVLMELMQFITDKSEKLANSASSAIPENGSQAPVGTTIALLEQNNKPQSSIMSGFYNSQAYELKLLFDLFGECLQDEPYPFMVPGKESAIMRQDFNDRVNLVPVADPNILSSTHMLYINQGILSLAQANPELYDLREANHRMLTSMKVDNIDKILKPTPEPVSADAITENMNMLAGKPVKATFGQPHEEHEAIHEKFAQEQLVLQNIPGYMIAMMHIQIHKACHLVEDASKEPHSHPWAANPQIFEMPTEQLLMMPEVQNAITKHDIDKLKQEQEAQKQELANQPKPVDPGVAMMAEIEQKREAAHLKDEIDKLKAEVEAFKAQLKYESEKAKMKVQQEIAQERNDVTVALAEMKTPKPYPGEF